MKKSTLIYFFLSILVVSLSALSKTTSISNTGSDKLEKLVFSVPYYDYPPFYVHQKNGEIAGLSIDAANDIAKQLGVIIELNQTAKTFDASIDMLAANQADIALYPMVINLARAKKVLFTQPALTFYDALLINRVWLAQHGGNETDDDSVVATIKKTPNNIGVMTGIIAYENAKKMFPQSTVINFYSWEQVIDALKQGKIQAIYYNDLTLLYNLTKQPNLLLNFKLVTLLQKRNIMGIALAKKHSDLLNWFNSYIQIKGAADLKTGYISLLKQKIN